MASEYSPVSGRVKSSTVASLKGFGAALSVAPKLRRLLLPKLFPLPFVAIRLLQLPTLQPCAKCAGTAFSEIQISWPLWQTVTLSFLLPQVASVTATITWSVAAQPAASVTVKVYVVVTAGQTETEAVVAPVFHR